MRRKGLPEGNSFDELQDQIQSLTACALESPFTTRKFLKYVLGCVYTLIFSDAYPQPMEVGGSKSGYDALHTIMAVGGPSNLLGHNAGPVKERVVDDDQILGSVRSVAENVSHRRTGHVREGFCHE